MEPAGLAAPQPHNPRSWSQHLSGRDLQRLTLFKWRYSLEAIGFTAEQVRQLTFVTWLYATKRAAG